MGDTQMTEATAVKPQTPWHFWLVSVLSVPWNGFGAYDYFMSKTAGDAYLRSGGMSEAQITFFHAMPAWTTVFWALGVWGAVAGTVLLFLRSRWAVPVFVASLIGLLGSLVYNYALSDGFKINGQQGMIINAVILAGCLFFVWYSRRMVKHGVLR